MPVDASRLQFEFQRMEQLILADPEVMARFDKDGDGHLNGAEWDAVRALVIARLEREAAQTAFALQAPLDIEAWADEPTADSGSVADGIFLHELLAKPARPLARTFGDQRELVLKRQDGLGQLYASSTELAYMVYARDESPIVSAHHAAGRLFVSAADSAPGRATGASFAASELATGHGVEVHQAVSEGALAFSIVRTSSKLEITTVRQAIEPLGTSFLVTSVPEGTTFTVRQRLIQPFTYDVIAGTGRGGSAVGVLERGWAGLGAFLSSGHDQVHLSVNRVLGASVAWGMVAVMIQIDLQAAAGRR